ncbi:Retrovirus-related Pol polyprotein from transposon TNT 1-94 [Symbiodinium microadriaticum]|uniref:Retrovirus-related Pol polyprotein from transposon TNT 1-94 n=1 Tax=Symbiodinium microadriaticum TaxID=2951 RepID=A0A1Q9CHN7_SYMMI|nr:Retrovirus-related Pol polyprotein from transposon TNT 1-94 [Symbiodinium microadriaticum]
MRKDFMSKLSEEVLLKETGKLVPGTEHTFLGRRLRHNGDSIDVCVSQNYIDAILDLYAMQNAKPVATTGSVTIAKTVPDTPLSPEEHSLYRTAVGKLLWLAQIRGDIAYVTKELSRDVTAPTMQSVAKLKLFLRNLIGTKTCVLRLRPSYQLSDGNCSLGVNVYVDSDWAGCSKTRKSTSGSTLNVLGCNMASTARTQGTLALSSGEAELYAIGQGVSAALFLRSMLLESGLAKKVSVIAHTDSTAGKSMATRFGTGKKTKHVEVRFLYVQNLVQMGLLRMAKIDGVRNPADLMTKYVATDVLRRLITHLGVVSNWFKGNAPTDANDADDHVARTLCDWRLVRAVTPNTASVLVVEAEIGTDDPAESQNGNLAIDAAIGIRPRPTTAPSVAATASTAPDE